MPYEKLIEVKIELRRRAVQVRKKSQINSPKAGVELANCFLQSISIEKHAVISGFSPIGSEIDPLILMEKLSKGGWDTVLPVVVGKGKPLSFRQWNPGELMATGAFGIKEPVELAPKRTPDVLLVPLLAFDRKGYRLGYGGGFYDRTLKQLRETGNPIAVGIGFSAQEVEKVPIAEYDQPLNWIVSEREAIKIGA